MYDGQMDNDGCQVMAKNYVKGKRFIAIREMDIS
jgi:hypothetical protein